jgi:hypothetical protein
VDIRTEIGEIIWIGIKDKIATGIKSCVGILYRPPLNSKWYNVNFIRDLNEEINILRDRYSNDLLLIVDDFNYRIGERQMELPHQFDVWENGKAGGYNFAEKRSSEDKSCNAEEKHFIDFCETKNFKILNGRFRSETRGEFTFVNKLGSSVIDYALTAESVVNNILDFKIGV